MTPRLIELVGAASVGLALLAAPQLLHRDGGATEPARPIERFDSQVVAYDTEVTGRVVDAAGQPVPGAAVVASSVDWPPRGPVSNDGVTTDAAGRFRITNLAPGRYSFFAIRNGHPPGASTAVVFALISRVVEIVLDSGVPSA